MELLLIVALVLAFEYTVARSGYNSRDAFAPGAATNSLSMSPLT